MESNDICTSCAQFNIQCFDRHSFPHRGIKMSVVASGAQGGCSFCSLINEIWPATRNSAGWVHMGVIGADTDDDALGITKLYFWSSPTYPDVPGHNVGMFHVVADPDSAAAKSRDVLGTYLERDATSPDHIKAINDWLVRCDGHEACKRNLSKTMTINSQDALLPNRCVRVKRTSFGERPDICLEETQGRRGTFIALSHRWDDDTELSKTTGENYPNRKLGNSFENIPQLFQDVFNLASRLDIPFVWIDSFCIVQDSDEDWDEESKKMGDYYCQARFTIAATTSNLYTGEPAPGPQIACLPYRNRSGQQQGHFYVFPSDYGRMKRYKEQISESELLSRGWVFQEWHLSRRVICFTPSGMFFQCRKKLPTTELGEIVDGSSGPFQNSSNELSLKAFWTLGDTPEDLCSRWEGMIDSYSRLKFKRPKDDRVVALRGIAQEFESTLASQIERQTRIAASENKFVAGLWLWCIGRGLLWQQVGRGIHERLSSFPTWSWASIYSATRWEIQDYKSVTRILECRIVRVVRIAASEIHLYNEKIGALSEVAGYEAASGQAINLSNLPAAHIPHGQRSDIRNNFAVLQIQGRMQPVLIRSYFESSKLIQAAALVTGLRREASGVCWRKVTLNGSQEAAMCGWASIEHPDLQAEEMYEGAGVVTYALLVMEEHGVQQGSIALGSWLPWHNPCSVLFLRRVEHVTNGFERIGVGRLFGSDVTKGFKTAVEREIHLV